MVRTRRCPVRLTDVFGLRTNEFYRSEQPLQVHVPGSRLLTGSDSYYEVLEPSTATTLATFVNTPQRSAAITVNKFRQGARDLPARRRRSRSSSVR